MKITRKNLQKLINEEIALLSENEENVVDLKPYGEWIEDLMNILRVDDPDQIPDITSYDAFNHGVTARRYADLIGEPSVEEEMVASPVSGDSDEDWIYELEGEMEEKMKESKMRQWLTLRPIKSKTREELWEEQKYEEVR